MRFQLHTLQLLPGRERPSYAGAAVEVLEGLDGRLSVRHERRIIAAQKAPPSPVLLRNGHGGVLQVFQSRPPVSTAWENAVWKLSTTALTGRGREWHKYDH